MSYYYLLKNYYLIIWDCVWTIYSSIEYFSFIFSILAKFTDF